MKFLLYFFNLFYLSVFFEKCKFKLQVPRLIEFYDSKNDIRVT